MFKLWASGLADTLGLAERDGWLYAVQRGEVTRLKDVDGDGRADVFETVCDDWGISGDYHEYPIGSKFDKDGNLWVVLCLTGSFTSESKYPRLVPADHARRKGDADRQWDPLAGRHWL